MSFAEIKKSRRITALMAHVTLESQSHSVLLKFSGPSSMQEFTTPSGVPFHVFIAKAADGTASILEEVGYEKMVWGCEFLRLNFQCLPIIP